MEDLKLVIKLPYGKGMEEAAVVGAYRRKGKDVRIMVDSDGTMILYGLYKEYAVWSGGLQVKAQKDFDQTPEGGIFKYRNMKLYRLTKEEIRPLIEGKVFVYTTTPVNHLKEGILPCEGSGDFATLEKMLFGHLPVMRVINTGK